MDFAVVIRIRTTAGDNGMQYTACSMLRLYSCTWFRYPVHALTRDITPWR